MAKKKGKTVATQSSPNVNGSLDTNASSSLKHVRFNPASSAANSKTPNGTAIGKNVKPPMHRSPSINTLNRLDRETYVLWKRPVWTLFYAIVELFCIVKDFLKSLLHWRRLIPTILVVSAALSAYFITGPHTVYAKRFEKQALWCLYWVWLGVLSSIGLGTGLHTFVLYLGPFIAHVTLAAFECNSVDFPEPPYPTDITCPTGNVVSNTVVSLWDIVGKVRLESLMWGVGTAFGELPPYFMARAARISGEEIDDEEYQEYQAYKNGLNTDDNKGILSRWKIKIETFMEEMIKKIGFPGILVLASVPNPFFDLAGMTCGHFLIPFWSFFGATLIGKAVVKMHLQMLCVVIAFSEHHVEDLVNRLKWIPYVGKYIQAPLKDFLRAQKVRLHRKPTDPVPVQATSFLQMAMNCFVMAMVGVFLLSLINSLAQRYHKRRCDQSTQQITKQNASPQKKQKTK